MSRSLKFRYKTKERGKPMKPCCKKAIKEYLDKRLEDGFRRSAKGRMRESGLDKLLIDSKNKTTIHWCGCETECGEKMDEIVFTKICEIPEHAGGNAWIAAQHGKEGGLSRVAKIARKQQREGKR